MNIFLPVLLLLPQAVWSQTLVSPAKVSVGARASGAAALSQAPVFSFPTTFNGMAAAYKSAEKEYLSAIERVLAIPSERRTFANTVQPLTQADGRFQEATVGASFMTEVSPDGRVRRMADAIARRMSRFGINLADRQDIYQAYLDVAAKGEALTGEDKKLLEETLRGYARQGMGLPPEQRERLNSVRKRLSDLSQAFQKNLREVNEFIDVEPARLEGLSQAYIDGRERTPEGKVRITLDYPSYGPFMELAKDSELRRQLAFKYANRAADKNMPVLGEVLSLRRELAGMLGYKTYAHYVIEERMAKAPEGVSAFLARLKNMVYGPARAEGARLLDELRRERPGAGKLDYWDRAFYTGKLQKRLYDLDDEEVRQYFPIDTVIKGALKTYEDMLGVRFTEKPAGAWSQDVRLFEISDAATGRRIGHFFLDLYPRPGKFNHMAAFSLVRGRELPDGSYRRPVSAMVGNFTKATPGRPSLLKHGEVETFFHEFGHLMHQTLTQARYLDFSGTRVARDFVEAPSQMMENFVWQPAILERISGHWQDASRKLPPELLAKMLAARNFNKATEIMGQIGLASLDFAYHTAAGPIDPMAVLERLWAELGLPAPTPGTHFPATFGHLMGYAASYYSYLWSLVYAQDIFSRFEAEGVENPEVGRSYRREILETGSSREEAESLRAFLGREPDEAAFLRHLGLPVSEPPAAPAA
ncbi:MAG: Zn-dependent oligopeptidase [Elusimicrobia bacterium]|nr:Zn-dependent oligopeptidase [Elusimicrobiota bacterium]